MSLSVYLYFDGDCKEAIDFYADVFGVADEDKQVTTYKDASDFGGNPEDADRVIRSSIKVGDMKILMADVAKVVTFVKAIILRYYLILKTRLNLEVFMTDCL
ncbi:hypothetical protein NBRC111893_472 [Lentilactobacillus kosonis]|uniref:Uncharacterized protein n=1 Tax=Lentilactobacillus kosonis TaxID=2810561 RepID=A0A401FJ59_9LACO|nr:VOC family protein [Lentilactobacillus kosonis]GAY72326.1 hypothetical protein NBRC111893_472 [Lentilactobacillus kosonis]